MTPVEEIEALAAAPAVALDTETTGLSVYGSDQIIGIAAMPTTREGVPLGGPSYFPFRHASNNLPLDLLPRVIQAISGKPSIFFNSPFDLPMLEKEDGYKAPPFEDLDDVLLSAHLLNENEESFKLKELGVKYTTPDAADKDKELGAILRKAKLGKGEMWKLPGEVVGGYACQDVVLTASLRRIHVRALERWKLDGLYREVIRYSEIIRAMEAFGLPVDMDALRALRSECHDNEERLADGIRSLTGNPSLNLASSKQLQMALGLPSTAEEYIETLYRAGRLTPAKRQIVQLLQEWRAWVRVRKNYCDAIEENMGVDGRSHANLVRHGTISGRLSCRKPPLQAVPAPGEGPLGRVRSLFRAGPGKAIINADYSQAELRMLAHYTKDAEMASLFECGADLHGEMAVAMGIPRDAAKRINFGVVYGLGARGLSRTMHIDPFKAKSYLTAWHRQRPGVRDLMDFMEGTAQQKGFIRLWTGRVRHYKDQDPHKAMSNLIQGGVAEIMRVAITRMDGFPMGLQVHDSVMFEADEKDALDLARTAKREMERDFPFIVPPKVDIGIGPSWGELSKTEV